MTERYLPGQSERGRWMRMDAASLLKRFFFCERSLVIAQGGWLAALAPLEIKLDLARFLWEDAMTAHALRERIFELRFPSRLLEIGEDKDLLEVFNQAAHAPGPAAFLLSLAKVFEPTMLEAYQLYMRHTDEIADGPTLRFLNQAIQEKASHIEALKSYSLELLTGEVGERKQAEAWVEALGERLLALGGVSLEPARSQNGWVAVRLPGWKDFYLPLRPGRDPGFYACRFYWPDILNPGYFYGEGIRLQLRSAVSHLNEVWAVEAAGSILYAFAEELGWEFIYDAARWTYDEARHCRMGLERLIHWGFLREEIPLGTYIYESAAGKDPIYLLGMLFFFETKNIGKKNYRIKAFTKYEDATSRHDMDYDWADETIHASYGQRWLGRLLEARHNVSHTSRDPDEIRHGCAELVKAVVHSAAPQELEDITRVAQAMIEKAERIACGNG